VLEMTREDEIIQVAHRIRPDNHEGEIWLLTNIPIDSLPPDELLTMRQVMDAPERVDVFKWGKVQQLLATKSTITMADLTALGIAYDTASKYLDRIAELPGWQKSTTRSNNLKGGRPTKAAIRG